MRKYRVIYADPPWEVRKIKRKVRPNQVEMDYPVMTLEAIKALPVKNITDDNAVLFLWTTHAWLPKSFEVMSDWGFKYQRTITWDKGNGLCLFGFHHRTEFLLFGYKGKIPMYPERKAMPTLITEHTHREHSRKPYTIYPYLEMFGSPRLEMFARQKVEGWDAWGNEVDIDEDNVEAFCALLGNGK